MQGRVGAGIGLPDGCSAAASRSSARRQHVCCRLGAVAALREDASLLGDRGTSMALGDRGWVGPGSPVRAAKAGETTASAPVTGEAAGPQRAALWAFLAPGTALCATRSSPTGHRRRQGRAWAACRPRRSSRTRTARASEVPRGARPDWRALGSCSPVRRIGGRGWFPSGARGDTGCRTACCCLVRQARWRSAYSSEGNHSDAGRPGPRCAVRAGCCPVPARAGAGRPPGATIVCAG